MEVHPAFVRTLIDRYETDFDIQEIINRTGELAAAKEFQECCLLARDFEITEECEERFGIIDQMLQDSSLDAAVRFCSTTELKRKIIPKLSTNKYHKIACKILDSDASLDPEEFPDLLRILKTLTARNLAKGQSLKCAADLLLADPEALGVFINSLEFHYSTKGDEYRGGIASDLLRSLPEVSEFVLPSVKQALEGVAQIPTPFGLAGTFGPLT